MTGRIGITCVPKGNGNSNKDLYFKSVSISEITDSYAKINYLLNIDDSNSAKLNIMVEINGEAYSNITIDKSNRVVTINGLSPGTDYSINLIASFDTYITRSKTIELVTSPPQIYGVRVNENDSNPFTAVTYIEDAIGTATATNTGLGGWENKFPFNRVRIVGFKNGQVTKEIKKDNKTQYTDGSTVPTDVDVMIEIPKVYWDFINTDNGYELRISESKFNETCDCYAHKVGTVEKDYIYVGAYLGYNQSMKLRSISGVAPTVNQSLSQFRYQAQANGDGYQQFNWFTLLLLQNLYLLAYKNLNSQTALGYGYANGNSNKINTGGTNTKGMIFGETGGRQQICFLGIEDFYGNIFQWVDGMFHNNSYQVTVTPDNKTFNDNGSGFKNVGKFVSSYGGGKISKVAHTNEGGFFPKEFNGSDTTYYCDYGYANSGCFARFGGYWNDRLDAGAFGLSVACSPSYSYGHLGSRLVFLG